MNIKIKQSKGSFKEQKTDNKYLELLEGLLPLRVGAKVYFIHTCESLNTTSLVEDTIERYTLHYPCFPFDNSGLSFTTKKYGAYFYYGLDKGQKWFLSLGEAQLAYKKEQRCPGSVTLKRNASDFVQASQLPNFTR